MSLHIHPPPKKGLQYYTIVSKISNNPGIFLNNIHSCFFCYIRNHNQSTMENKHRKQNQTHQHKQVPHEVDSISRLMDSKFTIPGTNFRFGVDPILSLIPGIGDLISFLISGGLIAIIGKHGASRKVIILMSLNAFIDAVFGSIPIIGGIFDFFFKANDRNVKLLRKHYQEGKYQGSGKGTIAIIIITMLILLAVLVFVVWKVIEWLWGLIQAA